MPCDYKKYPKDWKVIRQRILERENHRCKECGVENHDIGYRDKNGKWHKIEHSHAGDMEGEYAEKMGLKIIRIVLTIAHLNHAVTDNRDENLAALCQLHHLRHDKEHHMKNARETRDKKKQQHKLF